MAIKISLGNINYNSKKELRVKLSTFLSKTSDGIINNQLQIAQLNDLIRMHPRANEKIGIGIKYFLVLRNQIGKGKSFAIERLDGSIERFSYKTCISGYNQNKKAMIFEAFRFLVKSQMRIYRDSLEFPIKCELSNEIIKDKFQLHVDHVYPFSLIVEDFINKQKLKLMEVKIVGNGEAIKLKDSKMVGEFKQYHLKYAKYQPTLEKYNTEKSNKY